MESQENGKDKQFKWGAVSRQSGSDCTFWPDTMGKYTHRYTHSLTSILVLGRVSWKTEACSGKYYSNRLLEFTKGNTFNRLFLEKCQSKLQCLAEFLVNLEVRPSWWAMKSPTGDVSLWCFLWHRGSSYLQRQILGLTLCSLGQCCLHFTQGWSLLEWFPPRELVTSHVAIKLGVNHELRIG